MHGPPRRALVVSTVLLHASIVLALVAIERPFSPFRSEFIFSDVKIYFDYSSKILHGLVPYRDYAIEYPPLSLPFFVLPRLFAPTFARYKVAFAVEMLLINGVVVDWVTRRVEEDEGAGRVPGRLVWYTLFFTGLCPLLVCRFDIAATALAFAAALLCASGKPRRGAIVAGAGTLVKIFPGLIAVPAAFDRDRFNRVFIFYFLMTLIAGIAGWFALAGAGAGGSIRFHLERGVEVGSLPAGILTLVEKLRSAVPKIRYRNSSFEVVTPWSSHVAALALPLQAASFALVAWRSWGARGEGLLRLSTAAILGFVVFGKVLSPQYMIWLVPFMLVLPGRSGTRARAVFLLACLITTLLFPFAFHRLLACDGRAVALLNLRNGLLLGLWPWLVFGPVAALDRGFGRKSELVNNRTRED